MDILIMIAQLILSLSILVILHELGHFIPAKLFGTRVEKFYLFFNPWFSLFKKKIGDTEYGIGWLPLGGYVKISGMVDESMDKSFVNNTPEPYEFRSKPAWQRLIIMVGGVTVNFLLGFFIFAMLLFVYGEKYIPNSEVKYGISASPLAEQAGFMDGDIILEYNGKKFEKFAPNLLIKDILLEGVRDIKILREDQELTLTISDQAAANINSNQQEALRMIGPRIPTVIAKIAPDYPAAQSGLQEEDRIINVNGISTPFYDQMYDVLQTVKGQNVAIAVTRNGQDTLIQNVGVTTEGQLRISPYGHDKYFNIARDDYSLADAFPAGFHRGINFLGDQLNAFGKMFKGEIKASESLGGFASITKLFPTTWDWESFWRITAILSLILGFMNILPIPALDGGYIMFLIWEVITGKKVSDRVMEVATTIGIILLFTLLIYANGLDVFRAFK